MELLVIFLSVLWVLTVVGYVIFNLYNKNKKMENEIIKQTVFITNLFKMSKELDSLVNKIDTTIWVQSDPEILSVFETMKNINETLKQYYTSND
jgi:hypothetical protein